MSYGCDTNGTTNPYGVRLGKYVDLYVPDDVIGIKALCNIKAEGPKRHQLGVIMEDVVPAGPSFIWFDIVSVNTKIGGMTNIIWSCRLKKNIGFALVSIAFRAVDKVTVMRKGEPQSATLVELPFL